MSMTIEQANQMILNGVVVAGMRGAFPPATALKVCETMVEEDINIFEFTMNSQQPIEAMQAVKKHLGDAACVGMGTVLDVETARKVIDAGADFIVSPAFQPEVVEFVLSKGVFIAPGVITPSEAVAAWGMGVTMLKLFPIGSLGLDYFKSIFGPLDHMKFMCNGGMNDNNARELIQAGAVAVGMASWLTGDGTWTDSRLRSRARVLINAVAVAKGENPKEEV
jgi:2-dehydro-3-deoxyphosphogluconate aldolase / (4S)-4-hydroxy-2-oxoglutarate aldolase